MSNTGDQYKNLLLNPDLKEIEHKFNGALYLVKHKDMSRQYIGSGKTLQEAEKDAQETRERIINHWKNEVQK